MMNIHVMVSYNMKDSNGFHGYFCGNRKINDWDDLLNTINRTNNMICSVLDVSNMLIDVGIIDDNANLVDGKILSDGRELCFLGFSKKNAFLIGLPTADEMEYSKDNFGCIRRNGKKYPCNLCGCEQIVDDIRNLYMKLTEED